MNHHNGKKSRATQSTREARRALLAPPSVHNGCPANVHRPYAFSAADTEGIGFRLRLHVATHLLGLGTTGSQVIDGVVKLFQAESRRELLPASINYLLTDAAAPKPGMDTDHFYHLVGGVNGAGTDPEEGRKLFCAPQNYRQLRSTLNRQLVDMMGNDQNLPWSLPPRQVLDFWIVAGFGGTSGGGTHPAIALLHDVAQDRHIACPRIHVLMIGPEMPLRDRTRQVLVEQQRVVRATAAQNLMKTVADTAAPGFLHERRPDQTSFQVKASHRVWLPLLADQSNGRADCSTTDGLVGVVVQTLFARLFTQAGIDLADRHRDFDQLGLPGRARE